MWNNREFRIFTWCYFLMTLLISISCFCFTSSGYVMLVALVMAYICFYVYSRYRYHVIHELNLYLQKVYQGLESMDIRDYCEGELSILKSELYKITSVLQHQANSLRKDKTYLADSLSDISHQIRTPLTSMMVVSDLLGEDIPEEKRREFLHLFRMQLERLDWLVSALLKMSKIDADATVFHKESVSLLELLHKAKQPFLIPMELKHQTLTIHCDPSIMIQADRSWMIEAFSNLLKNGIEHTPEEGHIQIEVTHTPLHTKVIIHDDGEGIDEADLPHIFERFYKGKNATASSVGIGLALSKAILIQHQANIEVESVQGEGTTFIIKFYL